MTLEEAEEKIRELIKNSWEYINNYSFDDFIDARNAAECCYFTNDGTIDGASIVLKLADFETHDVFLMGKRLRSYNWALWKKYTLGVIK